MKRLRWLLGLLAVMGLAVALNVLVLREDLSTSAVLVPLALAVLFGLAWLMLRVATLTETYGAGKTLYGVNSVAACVIFFAICLVLYGFAARWDREWDLTREGRRELAPQTKQILQALPGEVEVIAFFADADDSTVDAAKDKTRRFLTLCQKYSPRLKVEFVDPVAEPGRVAELNLEEQRLSGVGTLVLRNGDRPPRVLPISSVTGRLEERDFTNALINVSRQSQPKVYILQGHDERDIAKDTNPQNVLGKRQEGSVVIDRGLLRFTARLQQESYVAEPLRFSIQQAPKIPDDCDILVVNDPLLPLRPDEIQAVQNYMDRGGRMLLMLDPAEGRPSLGVVQSWLRDRYGIDLGDNLLLSPITQRPREIYALPDIGKVTANLKGGFPEGFPGCFSTGHPITRGFDQELNLNGARSVDLVKPLPEGVVAEVILRSLPFTYAENDRDARQLFMPHQDPDEPEAWFGLAVAATARTDVELGDTQKTRDARLVVVGNGDIASNTGMIYLGHINFLMNAIAWLSESEDLIAIRPRGEEDPPIILTAGEEQLIAWIASLGVLQAIVVAGIGVHLWRRRYQ